MARKCEMLILCYFNLYDTYFLTTSFVLFIQVLYNYAKIILFLLCLVALWCQSPEMSIKYIIYTIIRKSFVETKSDDVSYLS